MHTPVLFDICIIGLGYIGLPTALLFANADLKVSGVDINPRVRDQLTKGIMPIDETGGQHLLENALQKQLLHIANTPAPAKAYIIAVPTPFLPEKTADLTYVWAAAEALAPHLPIEGALVILESTSPIGTTQQLWQRLCAARPDIAPDNIRCAYCPERVLPTKIFYEAVHNARIFGGLTPEAAQQACDLYKSFVVGETHCTHATTAEAVKLAENTFRDINIAYANELANVAEALNFNVYDVIALANRHPRVNILQPGPGVGGHCIAVDPWFFVSAAPEHTPLIRTARMVNDARPLQVVQHVMQHITAEAPQVLLLGLSYKANVGDARESPAMTVCELLHQQAPFSAIHAYDPHIALPPADLPAGVTWLSNMPDLQHYKVVVLLTDHDAFNAQRAALQAHACVIDTRGFLRTGI